MVSVSGGELQITSSGKDPTGAGNESGGVCWCLGGNVHRYGTWEIGAKFDAGTEFSPELGLFPEDNSEESDGSLLVQFVDGARTRAEAVLRLPGGGTVRPDPAPGDFTDWATYRIDWRADYLRVSVDGRTLLDTRTAHDQVIVPSHPMYLYLQQRPGPSGATPGPGRETPDRVVMHIDWLRYTWP